MKVYKYGLLPPTTNADLVRQQIRAAHTYRNTLVEIERGRRAAERALLSSSPAVLEAEEQVAAANVVLENALKVVKTERALTRTRSESAEQRAAIKAARETLRAALRSLSSLRKEAKEAAKAPRDEINARALELTKSARAHADLYWGTYILIEEAANQSRFSLPLYDGASPNDPRFARWMGEGQVGVHIQATAGKPPFLTEHTFLGKSTVFQIDPVDERAWLPETPRGERRRLSRTKLRIRIGSDEKRNPTWAEWPMVMHRGMPDGLIKRATVSLRRVGPREEWTVEITIDDATSHPTCGEGIVAVHLGWLQVNGGIRAATWMDPTGESGEVVLGDARLVRVGETKEWQDAAGARVEHVGVADAVLSGIDRTDSLRATRDKSFNDAREALRTWIKHHEIPEWMQARTHSIHGWRSAGRLAALALHWRSNRWDGDQDGYAALEAWRYHDHHLWQWESSQRTKTLRRRREVYRVFAADLSRKYKTLIIDNTKLDELAKKKSTEEPGDVQAARSNRHKLAVSELRTCLVNAFKGRGGEVILGESTGISTTCPVCGTCDALHRDTAQHRCTCLSCTYSWSMDKTALVNSMKFAGVDVEGILVRKKAADEAARGIVS